MNFSVRVERSMRPPGEAMRQDIALSQLPEYVRQGRVGIADVHHERKVRNLRSLQRSFQDFEIVCAGNFFGKPALIATTSGLFASAARAVNCGFTQSRLE